jgi:hypothetical protein
MKQYYHNYIYWEDYISGMYDTSAKHNEEELVNLAIKLLSNENLFFDTCKEVIKHWTISSRVNLTNKTCNRKAWLGQASCCYLHGVPEIYTRIAWGKLSSEMQYKANLIAEKIINSFELNYEKKDKELYI